MPEGFLIKLVSKSPLETIALGHDIAGILKHNDVVALSGTLGSGKTCLVKGIAGGLGIDEIITSPTYTIINEYKINAQADSLSLFHIDAYRLENENDFENIGGGEIITSGGISVIEWSENIIKSLPPIIIKIDIIITGGSNRLILLDIPE